MNTNGTNGGPTRAAEIEAAVDAAVPGGWPRFALLAYARSSGAGPDGSRALAVLAAQALEELEAAGSDVSGVRAAVVDGTPAPRERPEAVPVVLGARIPGRALRSIPRRVEMRRLVRRN